MRTSLTFAAFFTMVSFTLVAQTFKQKGFVILNNGETVHGWIDYEPWRQNPSEILFRKEIKDKQPFHFDATQVKYFEVQGKDAYKSADLKEYKTVFLRCLVKGKLSLYEFTLGLMSKYYIQKEGEAALTELKYLPVLHTVMNQDGSEVTIKEYHYIATLLQLSQPYGNNDLNFLIMLCEYYADDLVKIVRRINEMEGGSIAVAPRPIRKKMNWFIGAGAGLTSFEPYGHYSTDYIQSGIGSYFSLCGGFNLIGDEGMVRFQGIFSRASYLATTYPNDPNKVRHVVQQYSFTPEASFFISIINKPRWRLFTGGGFQFPWVLLQREKLQPPGANPKTNNIAFDGLGWTACHSSAVRINSRWEVGYTITLPTITHEKETNIYYFPANYYTQLIYHFR